VVDINTADVIDIMLALTPKDLENTNEPPTVNGVPGRRHTKQ